MMLIPKLALRNLLGAGLRTWLNVFVLSLSFITIIFLQGMYSGMLKQVEVATFRTETGYVDGRHPGKIEFSNARDDAARRDFTINGMFYDPLEKKVLDFVEERVLLLSLYDHT